MGQIFISHASEDQDTFVRPLAETLRTQGLDVWYAEYSLRGGDSLRRSIDRGLAAADIGLIILSRKFFKKGWTQYELDVLHSRQMDGDKVKIVPI